MFLIFSCPLSWRLGKQKSILAGRRSSKRVNYRGRTPATAAQREALEARDLGTGVWDARVSGSAQVRSLRSVVFTATAHTVMKNNSRWGRKGEREKGREGISERMRRLEGGGGVLCLSASTQTKALEERIGAGAGRVMRIKTHYYCRIACASRLVIICWSY